MAGPIIPKPVLVLSAHCSTVAGLFQNISYWSPISPPITHAAVQLMVNDFSTQVAPLYRALMYPGNHYRGASALWTTGAIFFEASTGIGAGVGLFGTMPVSDQNAAVIRKNTGEVGRAKRGRYFVGGMAAEAFDPVNPDELESTTAIPLYQALASYYGADIVLNTVTCHARHWDRKDNLLVPVADCSVSSRVGTRRDRRQEAPDFAV